MIGPFIDNLMDNNKDNTLSTGHKDSFETLLDNDKNDYYILGVDTKEKTKFKRKILLWISISVNLGFEEKEEEKI
jgi:hypothetical protein